MAHWITAYLGLGANLGDRAANIKTAMQKLAQVPTIRVVRISSLYETAPVGMTDQPDFLNAAAEIETTLSPQDLLAQILQLESIMGRVRTQRWGPRTIDIDILTYGTQVIEEPGLSVPHPRLKDRAFALIPLAEVAPDMVLPGSEKNLKKMAEIFTESGNI